MIQSPLSGCTALVDLTWHGCLVKDVGKSHQDKHCERPPKG